MISNNNTVLLPLLLLLTASAFRADASISFLDSGAIFPSKMDYGLGLPLTYGYEYMAHIQVVRENPTLCPQYPLDKDGPDHPFEEYNIIRPSDGLPVAVMAEKGGCSDRDKMLVASRLISPENTVRYLIIRDDFDSNHRHRTPLSNGFSPDDKMVLLSEDLEMDVDEDNESYMPWVDRQGSELDKAEAHHKALMAGQQQKMHEQSHELPLSLPPPTERWGYGLETGVDLAVMHVSRFDGAAIFDLLRKETYATRSQGGARIILKNDSSGYGARTVIFWMLVTFSCCACACACLLFCVHTTLEDITGDTDEAPAPRRPARRKLTVEEVRERFPSYRFYPEEHQQLPPVGACCSEGDGCGEIGGETGVAAAAAVQEPRQAVHHDYMQLSDECTICLDEFLPGVKVRKLPCDHVFHSMCIARWLVERSAVCPLCKLDLYIEPPPEEESEDEDEDDDEVSETIPPLSAFFLRMFNNTNNNNNNNSNSNNSTGYSPITVAMGSAEEAEAPTEQTEQRQAEAEESSETRSWWPFSLEIVDGEEEPIAGSSSRSRRLGLTSAATSAVSWTWNSLTNVSIGRRRRRHATTDNNNESAPNSGDETADDNNRATELTEPLLSSPMEETTSSSTS